MFQTHERSKICIRNFSPLFVGVCVCVGALRRQSQHINRRAQMIHYYFIYIRIGQTLKWIATASEPKPWPNAHQPNRTFYTDFRMTWMDVFSCINFVRFYRFGCGPWNEKQYEYSRCVINNYFYFAWNFNREKNKSASTEKIICGTPVAKSNAIDYDFLSMNNKFVYRVYQFTWWQGLK